MADHSPLRERLEALMAFRVVIVTLFLGAALAADVAALSDFSDVRNAAILTLIVGTYALTIFYALLLRQRVDIVELATAQLTIDLVTVLVIVDVTRGLDSPFLFLFLLVIVNAALVFGRRAAIYTAAASTIALLVLAFQTAGIFDPTPAEGHVWRDAMLRVTTNAAAGFIVAYLAGALVERLGEATTQLAEQQSSLRELRALNENILSSLSSGLLTVDSDNTVIFFNTAAERIIGRSSDDVLGVPLRDVLPEVADFVEHSDALEEARLEAKVEAAEGRNVYLGFSVSVLRGAEDQDVGRIVIFQDLSDIKRLEQQMRRSERLAAVGALSAAIAHEIRNPLASISGSVEMLAEESDATDEDIMLRQIIHREVDRLDKLISDFLEYAGERPLNLEPHDPIEIVQDVLELFQKSAIGQDIDVECRFPDTPLTIPLDQPAFRQVIWNLLNNAADATRDTESPRIEIAITHTDAVRISVADNGPGIALDDPAQVFQPFFTTRPTGTGLGLASIYRIVEDHGASIEVEPRSDLGGASFEITFATR